MNRWTIFPITLTLLTAIGYLPRLARGEEPHNSRPAPPVVLSDAVLQQSLPTAVDGEQTLAARIGERGTVVVFLSAECPISNGYIPTLNRLAEEFQQSGVRVVGVNSNAGQSLKRSERHSREFDLKFVVFKDAGGELAREVRAAICPEVVLFNSEHREVYRGRIDDRYTQRGGGAKQVHRADLELALRQMLDGKPIEVSLTRATGCPIDLGDAGRPASNTVAKGEVVAPTYTREVSRILQQHCQECHRPAGIGPFALETYVDARRWADDIVQFTASRQMPPWKATPGFGDLAHPRNMEQPDIDRLAAWVQAGCPQGDPHDLPAAREFTSGWKLGREPDAVFEADEYTLGADGPDEYRCFVIPTRLDGDRYVTGVEVRPGNDKVVHHVIAFIDTTGKARRLDERYPGPGYATSAGFPGFLPSGGLGGWAPGNQPRELPAGMARLLPQGADIALQVHYHRSGRPETDQTRIGVYFSKTPVERCVRNVPVLPLAGPLGDLVIPADSERFEVRTALVMPIDMQAVAVTPHMHLLGKDMRVIARLPDGTVVPLVEIRDWDFNWQESYPFREPLLLPRLTRIEVVAHFDNSSENPNNPRRPPQAVRWGESTDEEMCIAFVEMAPARKEHASLKAPTRAEQLKFFIESQMLDDSQPRLEKLQLLRRFTERLTRLEQTGGLERD